MSRAICHVIAAFLVLASLTMRTAAADTILVPSEVPTIQQAIDLATDGDTVQVASGTYYESINFHGRSITVTRLSSSLAI